jgi:hypothetical protein
MKIHANPLSNPLSVAAVLYRQMTRLLRADLNAVFSLTGATRQSHRLLHRRQTPSNRFAGRLLVQPEYESILSANQLADIQNVLSFQGGTIVREVPGRQTRRIQLNSPDGSKLTAYLKCYDSKSRWWQKWLSNGEENCLESLNEWKQMFALRAHGVRTAAPIAVGWQKTGSSIQSFVLSAEIPHAISGYDFWKTANDSQQRSFIQQLAELAQRFHGAGFIHKDFYLDHVFVEKRDGELKLSLIDLQRVLGPGQFRDRWLVKDTGSMLFSLQKAGAKSATVLRFFKLSQGQGEGNLKGKGSLRKALKRAAWVHRRKPKYGKNRAELNKNANSTPGISQTI